MLVLSEYSYLQDDWIKAFLFSDCEVSDRVFPGSKGFYTILTYRRFFHKLLYEIISFLLYSSNLVGLATRLCILLLHGCSRKRALQSGLLVNANCTSYVSLSSKVFLGLICKLK